MELEVGGFGLAETVCFDWGEGFSVLFFLFFDDHHRETAVIGPLTIRQFWGLCLRVRVIFLLCLFLFFGVIEVKFYVISISFNTQMAGLSSDGLHGIIDVFLVSSVVSLNSKGFTFFSSSNF